MSAFVVSKRHIDVIVDVAIRGPRGRAVSPDTAWSSPTWYASDPTRIDANGHEDYFRQLAALKRSVEWNDSMAQRYESGQIEYGPSELGAMLWAENVRSVRYRYSDADDGMIPLDFMHGYEFERPAYQLTAVEALSAIGCFDYQACESPDYSDTEASQFIDVLRHALINALPGYREAPWEWDDEKIATARHAQFA